MKWSLKIGRVAGIALYIHWTFLILIGWLFFSGLRGDGTVGAALSYVGFVLAVFGCVLVHELGHALAARRYGVATHDITLLPIGGVARLERIPENPTQELVIAVAGPLVNVVIAAALFAAVFLTGDFPELPAADDPRAAERFMATLSFPFKLMIVNVLLVVFNMLPAFPMDGGRVLRALLAYRLDYPLATRIAARVGQAMAILFAVWGLYSNPFLLLIALFVFLGAEAESQSVRMRSAFTGLTVQDGMMTRFRTLSEDDSLEVAAQELLAGSQQDFPVVGPAGGDGRGVEVIGVLPRTELLKAMAARGMAARVGDAMHRNCPFVGESDPLEETFRRMREIGCTALPVVRGGQLVGLITLENIGEVAMVRSAQRKAGDQA